MNKNRIRPRDSRNLFFRDGVWWVDIQIEGKRYREVAGPTEARARNYRDKLRSWKRDSGLGLPANKPEGAPVTFEAFADDYLALYAKRKRSYERDVRSMKLLKAFFKGWMLKNINGEAVARYRASREKVSVATINRELACLRTALRKAVEWGKLASYPLPTSKLLEREPEFKPRILTAEEAERLIRVADPRWLRPAVIVWLGTGLRKMELLKLKHEHVDLKKKLLTVVAENSKNGKARTIEISNRVAETLAAMPGEVYFFENPTTKRHLGDLIEPFRRTLEPAEIKGRVRIHDLRDTYATQSLRRGVDIRTVADLIGDSPEVALKRYCHSDERTRREAVEKMAGFGLGSRPILHGEAVEGAVPASESIS
jgi:integrase